MNRLTQYSLQNIIDGVKIKKPVSVYCGGPMANDRLFFLHTLGEVIPGCRKIKDNLFVGGDFDAVMEYVNLGYPLEGYLRFFLGYSGWSRLQLDEEISNRVWAVTESTDYS